MRVETSSNIPTLAQSTKAAQASKYEKLTPEQDRFTISGAYQKFSSVSGTKQSAKVTRLLESLRGDTSFVENKRRCFLEHPVAREAAKAMILEDKELQEEVAKEVWSSYELISPSYIAQSKMYVPASYKEINVKALLMSSDRTDVDQALIGYEAVLRKKATTFGLTEDERLLSARAEEVELSARGTFDQQMAPVFQAIKMEFENEGLEFDQNKTYEFSLDTDVFAFNVSGGTDEENAIIERVVNTSNYKADHFHTVLAAMYEHRQDDGKYTPWRVDSFQHQEAIPVYGIASVSEEYAKKMNQLFAAYNRCRMDQSLKEEYGFSYDDMLVRNGKVVGKTAEITKIIQDDYHEFMKTVGYPYLYIQKHYTGTPEFTEPVFKLEGGQFHTTYQVYNEQQEGATDSAAMLERVTMELEKATEEERNRLQQGRNAILAICSPNSDSDSSQGRSVKELLDQLVRDSASHSKSKFRFFQHPLGRTLAVALVRNDPNLQSQISDLLNPLLFSSDAPFLPVNSYGIDIAGILNGSDETAIQQVLMGYDSLLNKKKQTNSLTEIERYLKSRYL